KDGMILNVIFSSKPNEELKQLLDKNQIEYSVKLEELKTFENFNIDTIEGDFIVTIDMVSNGHFIESKIPNKVTGSFNCSNNQLTSLEGCPTSVGGSFYCFNNQLTSLEGGPTKVGIGFYCSNNQLTSLEGSPKNVQHLDISNLPELKTLYGGPEKVNTSPSFY